MSQFVSCPQCERKLHVPEQLLGQHVRCPSCSTEFLAGGESRSAAPPSNENEGPQTIPERRSEHFTEDRPSGDSPPATEGSSRDGSSPSYEISNRPQSSALRRVDNYDDDYQSLRGWKNDAERPAWTNVRKGLTMLISAIFISLGLGLLVFFLGMALGLSSARNAAQRGQRAGPDQDLMEVVNIGSELLGLAIGVLSVVGYGYCAAAPSSSGAKGLGVAAFVLAVSSIIVSVATSVAGWTVKGMNPAQVGNPQALLAAGGIILGLAALRILLSLALSVTFLLFLKTVAQYLREEAVARSVKTVLTLFVVGIGGLVVVIFLLIAVGGVAAAGGGGAGMRGMAGPGLLVLALAMCILGIVLLVAGIWYLVVLFQVRGVVSRHAEA